MAGIAAEAHAPLSRLARAQYAALASMRWSMFRNSIRSTKGALELGARIVTTLMFSLMGGGMAFGIGMGAYQIVHHGNWELLPVLFWAVFVLWQVVPITMASFQQQFDMSGVLRFPVSFGTFYLLDLLFGLIDVSTIVGGFCCVGVWTGITLARPDLWAWTAAAVITYAAFNVFLVRTIFSWIDRWLAQRRSREIVMAVFFVGLLGLQLLNPGLRQHKEHVSAETRAAGMRWLRTLDTVQRWLPPGLAALTVRDGEEQKSAPGLEALLALGLFAAATGGTLAVRLRAEYRGENLGEAPSREKAERRRGASLIDGSGPVAAVLEKELRTLMRAIPLLYQVGTPILVVFVLASVNRNRSLGSSHVPLGLLLCLAYAIVGFTQMIYNNLGTEGAGIQILFLSPTPIRTVLLAKNLFHTLLFAVDAVLVAIVACWRLGTPPAVAIAASAAWVVFALPVHLAAGNAFSIAMPYKINLGRIGRQKGSQANALLSMLVQAGTLGVGVVVFALCAWFHRLWIALPIFFVMAAFAVFAWFRVLGNVDSMANKRRDDMIATLVKAE